MQAGGLAAEGMAQCSESRIWDSFSVKALHCQAEVRLSVLSEAFTTHHPGRVSKASDPHTYKHLNGDRDGAVERGVASILGHDC